MKRLISGAAIFRPVLGKYHAVLSPSHDTLYKALIARDPAHDGKIFVCVGTTGIFCRLTCPARKPLSENCVFRSSVRECLEAGFRPCKRCYPLHNAAESDPIVSKLLGLLDAEPGRRWRESDIAALGFDLSTVRRSFRRHFDMTFLDMARQYRLREGFLTLSGGERVIEAQLDSGFTSPSAFREAFARLLGCAPGTLKPGGMLQASWIPTPLGDMIAVASTTYLHLLEFVDRKALPAELGALQKALKAPLGLGSTAPVAQARDELAAFSSGKSTVSGPRLPRKEQTSPAICIAPYAASRQGRRAAMPTLPCRSVSLALYALSQGPTAPTGSPC